MVFISVSGAFTPKKAEAFLGLGDIVTDIVTNVQSAISAIANTASSISNYATQYKEFVLDPIAYAITKQIVRQLTSSVVNWINSGFDGSPSFVTDPAGFFTDIADQLTGEFIDNNSVLKKQLCGPFNFNLRLALALKYRPYSQQKYTCTLTSVIKNAGSGLQNFSINGFTAGDFKQGRWPAFVSLTTEPQNNFVGASILAQDDLAFQIGSKQGQQRDELTQGDGFLSWKKCKDIPLPGDSNFVGPVQPGTSGSNNVGSNFVGPINTPGGQAQRKQSCEVQTPGKVISDALNVHIASPTEQLNLADEFNEIVNALFAQLVTTILNGGLRSASGSGPSDSSSYLNQIANEQDSQTLGQLDALRKQVLDGSQAFFGNAIKYQQNKAKSLAYAQQVMAGYTAVKNCYASTTIAATMNASIDQYVATNVKPTFDKLTIDVNAATEAVNSLIQIQLDAKNATTTNALNQVSLRYGNMLQTQSVIGADAVVNSEYEINTIQQQMAPFLSDSQQKLQQCVAFKTLTGNGN
jgi:hypothetical protein